MKSCEFNQNTLETICSVASEMNWDFIQVHSDEDECVTRVAFKHQSDKIVVCYQHPDRLSSAVLHSKDLVGLIVRPEDIEDFNLHKLFDFRTYSKYGKLF